jgi:hypothetical protein
MSFYEGNKRTLAAVVSCNVHLIVVGWARGGDIDVFVVFLQHNNLIDSQLDTEL